MKKILCGGWLFIAPVIGYTTGAAQHHQLIIIGSGPAGLTAAIYAGRAKLKPLVISSVVGGVLTTVPDIENWPGHQKISGAELMQPMIEHAQSVGAEFIGDDIKEVNFKKKPFFIKTVQNEFTADAVIVAPGMQPKKIGCPGEQQYWGKGVCNCALCDAPLYNGRVVAVVGGGMMAMHNVLFLSKHAKKICIINDQKKLTGPKDQITQITKFSNVEILSEHVLDEIIGDGRKVSAIIVHGAHGPKTLAVDGVFISMGYESATGMFRGQLDIDEQGKIKIDALGHTNIKDVFAAGNAATVACSQAIVCAASGCIAAVEAEKALGRKPRKKTLLSCQKA